MHHANHEVMRLALASAVLRGSGFRRRVLARLRDAHHAQPVELGLDLALLGRACYALESRHRLYQWAGLAALAVLAVAFAAEAAEFLLLALLAMTAIHFAKAYRDRFVLVRRFRDPSFDLAGYAESLPPLPAWAQQGLSNASLNVIVYPGYNPFEAAGTATERISFAVDVTRRAAAGNGVTEVSLARLYRAVESRLEALGRAGLRAAGCLVVHGRDLATLPELLPDRFARPKQTIPLDGLLRFMNGSDNRARYYLRAVCCDWGGELMVSYFVRFSIKGPMLFVELTQCVLTPLAEQYREVDRLANPTLRTKLAALGGAVANAPFAVAGAALALVSSLVVDAYRLLGLGDRRIRKAIRTDPAFSYGAPASLRAQMASGEFRHYFQRMDSELYEKSVPRQVIECVIDFLEEHGVDVSSLKESRTTIINSGLLVQGGDIVAQSLAVGERSNASVSSRLARFGPRRAAAAATR